MKVNVKPVSHKDFSRFGQLVSLPPGKAPSGNECVHFWPALGTYEVKGKAEIGLCRCLDRPHTLDSLETHSDTPEVLMPIDGPFLLPVAASPTGDTIDAHTVEVFQVPAGQAVIMGPDVSHWAVFPSDAHSVLYLVIFKHQTADKDLAVFKLTEEVTF